MNTGMQDAFNLAWKLALVVRGTCAEKILDSYTPERSYVGDEVLKAAGRLTNVATIKNPVLQRIRNAAGHLLLGISFVTREVADTMAEVAIHYPDSPLNGPHMRLGLQPGDRVPPTVGQSPVGSGDAPKFALFTDDRTACETLIQKFGSLVDAEIRPSLAAGSISLARPDGYLACSADQPPIIAAYLRKLIGEADPQSAAA